MEALEMLGALAVILGITGMWVMLKGKRPTYPSSTERVKSK